VGISRARDRDWVPTRAKRTMSEAIEQSNTADYDFAHRSLGYLFISEINITGSQ
jgi:hypothetical protein